MAGDLSPAARRVLMRLRDYPCTFPDLVRDGVLTRSQVTRVKQELREAGLIERYGHANVGRPGPDVEIWAAAGRVSDRPG